MLGRVMAGMVLTGVMLALPVFAQDEEQTSFEAAGLTHVVEYAPRFADRVEAVIEVAQGAYTRYDLLWASPTLLPVSIVLVDDVLVDESGGEDVYETYGVAQIDTISLPDGEVTGCEVAIFDAPDLAADVENLQFTVAHEIAHCFQLSHFEETSVGALTGKWWSEGSAEWMATLVMPMPAPFAEDRGGLFLDSLGQSLFTQSYDAMYFWQNLTYELSGEAGVIEFIKSIPDDPTAQAEYLAALPDIDGIFERYGKAVQEGGLNYLPVIEYDHLPTAAPTELPFAANPFSLNFYRLDISTTAGNSPVFLTDDLEENGARIAIGDERILLRDGGVAQVCPPKHPLPFVLTRAAGFEVETIATVNVRLDETLCDITPTPTPDPTATPTPVVTVVAGEIGGDDGDDTTGEDTTGEDTTETEGGGAVPSCMVGTWRMVRFGQLPGGAPPMDVTGGDGRVTLNADGSTTTDYNGFTIASPGGNGVPPMSITITGTMTGAIAIDSATGVLTSARVDSASVVASATVAGTTMELPMNDLSLYGGSAGVTITLRCVDDNTLEWSTSILLSPFVFERVE